MNKFKIEVKFSEIFEVEGIDTYEAKQKAKQEALKSIEEHKENGLNANEYTPTTNWKEEAEAEAEGIVKEIKLQITEAVREWKESNEGLEAGESDIDEISQRIQDEVDYRHLALEYADGKFIYNDNESIKEALDAISWLEEYEETDAGIWQGIESPKEQINAKATYTYANALTAKTEETIKEAITQELAK